MYLHTRANIGRETLQEAGRGKGLVEWSTDQKGAKKKREKEREDGLLEYILESKFPCAEIATGRFEKRKRGEEDIEKKERSLSRKEERKTKDRGFYRERMHSTLARCSLAKAALRNSRRTSGECRNSA